MILTARHWCAHYYFAHNTDDDGCGDFKPYIDFRRSPPNTSTVPPPLYAMPTTYRAAFSASEPDIAALFADWVDDITTLSSAMRFLDCRMPGARFLYIEFRVERLRSSLPRPRQQAGAPAADLSFSASYYYS